MAQALLKLDAVAVRIADEKRVNAKLLEAVGWPVDDHAPAKQAPIPRVDIVRNDRDHAPLWIYDAVGERPAQADVGIIGGAEYSRSAPVAAALESQDIGIKNRRRIKVVGVDPADLCADTWPAIVQIEPPIGIRIVESGDR